MNKKFLFVFMTLVIVASIVISPAVVPNAPYRVVHGEKLAATAPSANFSGDPTSGPAPLQVQFTDESAGTPTGWAWYFGDESFDEPWTQMTPAAGWTKRYDHTSVALPDGSIVLMGGYDGSFRNDVWHSTDQGATWTPMPDDAPWTGRYGHTSVALPDGSIVLMGGRDSASSYRNDVWRSTDQGANWTMMPETPEWTPRYRHTSVVLPDGSVVLMGGFDGSNRRNDVWRSTNQGANWTKMTDAAQWTGRSGHDSLVLPDGSIVLMGGKDESYRNDVWRSTNQGATWTKMTDAAQWTPRAGHSIVVLPDGSIVLMGGYDGFNHQHDVWRSIDQGATWTMMAEAAEWVARYAHTSVSLPDGNIVLIGGYPLKSDAWRLKTAGSSEQHPTHSYAEPGIYSVALQVYNADGISSARQNAYINVTAATPDPDPTPDPPPDPTPDPGEMRYIFLPLILRSSPTPVMPPNAPILNKINNDDGNGNYPVSWSTSAGAENYTLQESMDSNFANAGTVYSGPNTFKDISGRDVGTYYYRVRAENASGQSDWSNTQSVVVTVPFVPEDWKIIKLPGSGFYPSLALDSGGNPHISSSKGSTYVSGSESWLDGRETRATGDIQYIRWDGNEWESHVVDTLSITYNANTSLAIDQNDQPQIAYPYWNPGKLVHAAWNGVAWQRTYITGPAPFYVNLALKANGDPCISHLESNLLPNGMDIYYLCRTGETWGMSRYVATVTWNIGNYVSYYHSLALASDGTPHISFYHGIQDSGALLYYSTLVDGLWKSNAVDGKGTGSYSSLALDSQDRPHISYHDHTNGDLKYARWDGSQWQIETIDSSGIVGQFTSLALDGDGHPHISYIDATNQNLKYTFWDGSQWQIEVIDDSGKVWRWTSLALDDSGFAHISYGTWEGLKYATNSGFPGE